MTASAAASSPTVATDDEPHAQPAPASRLRAYPAGHCIARDATRYNAKAVDQDPGRNAKSDSRPADDGCTFANLVTLSACLSCYPNNRLSR